MHDYLPWQHASPANLVAQIDANTKYYRSEVDGRLVTSPSKELVGALCKAEMAHTYHNSPKRSAFSSPRDHVVGQRGKEAGVGAMLTNEALRLVLTAVLADIPWSRVRVEAVTTVHRHTSIANPYDVNNERLGHHYNRASTKGPTSGLSQA